MNDRLTEPSTIAPQPSWPTWVARLTLISGVAVGGVALVSALGIWVGLWDFRTGFALLRPANSYAIWLAGLGLIITIGLFVFCRLRGIDNGTRISALAAVGTIAAALAYYIPMSYGPPDGVTFPPIHDVSTDTVNPPEFIAVLPLRADSPNSVVYGEARNTTHETLAEMQTKAFPDLVTVVINEPPDAVFQRALAAINELGWELVTQVPEEGRIEATDTTFWFRFKDDVVIRIRPTAEGSAIDARSLSRVGLGDVGTNAKRLRAFFATL
ncbi:MAG: DUF1499 domain-containing protein [Steroidobacteraceae bacterium]